MSCISVSIGKVTQSALVNIDTYKDNASIEVESGDYDADIEITSPSTMDTNIYCDDYTARINTGNMECMSVNTYLICMVNLRKYIFVSPEEAMWITVDSSVDYDIRSNTDWLIE